MDFKNCKPCEPVTINKDIAKAIEELHIRKTIISHPLSDSTIELAIEALEKMQVYHECKCCCDDGK